MGSRILAGRYELLSKIGEGGMSVVFKARDVLLDRYVAIKILRPEYTTDKSFIDSFLRESQLIAGIIDTNIVQVYDVGQEGNIHYIVMELVEGKTLSDIITEKGKLDAHTVVNFGKQIAMALSTAHNNNLIHRDIKPHNILVTADGVAKLTDFGIAKRVNPNENMSGDEKEAVMGSIHYFSPEQARGQQVDERTDIYSLGIVMYEMITGRVPFDGDNAVEVAVKHMNEPVIPPSMFAYDMPQDLEDIIMKAVSKNPRERYRHADDMIYALNLVKYSKLVKYDPEKKNTNTKSKKKKTGGLAIFVALCIALVPLLWGIFDIVTASIKEHKMTVEVPDLYEKNYEEAEKLLEELGLDLSIDATIENDRYDAGTVLSQTPSQGSVVKPGHTIKVNVTRLSSDPVVPELSGYVLSVAQTKIISCGLKIGTITEDYSDTVEKDIVIYTTPKAGTTVSKGSSVDILVSKGKNESGNTGFSINLVGMTEENAIKLIESKGCTYTISYQESLNSGIDRGSVISQSPSADQQVEKGTNFQLIVRNKQEDKPEEKNMDITVDISQYNHGQYNISIIVTDDYDNKDGVNQVDRVPIERNDDISSISFTIHGTGQGNAMVVLENDIYNYYVNFEDGTYEIAN